jgi:putative nucleotidyltransferase with HDIG domain
LIYLGLIEATGDIFIHQPILYQFLFCLMAVGVTYLITTSLISIGISLDTSTSLREIWQEQFSWLAPYYLVMGLIAYTLVFSFRTAGLTGTIITLVPLLLLRFSQMQYIERTKMVVQEIREKNTALQKSSFEIQRLNDGLMDTLAEVVDLRDPHVLGHSKQVARYAELMAKKLGLHPRQVELVRKSGLLHDIGKLGISEKILFKPDRLTSSEHNVVKQHSNLGADLLENSRTLKELIPIIRYHHEHYDGGGYPDGLQGTEIPIEARILAVADAVEAMATDRPYRHGMSTQEILDELNDHSGTQFDPRIVKAFTQVIRSGSESVIVNSARTAIGDEKSSASGGDPRGSYPELRQVEG